MSTAFILLLLFTVVTFDVSGDDHNSGKQGRANSGDLEEEVDDIVHALHANNEFRRRGAGLDSDQVIGQSSRRRGAGLDSGEVIGGNDNGGWGNGASNYMHNIPVDEFDDDNDWSHSDDFERGENAWSDSMDDEVDDDAFWGV